MAIETLDEILLQGISQCDLSKGMWYLDTGASGHMIGGRELICDLDDSYKGTIRFGDGSKISIEGKGKIILNSKDNTHITLKNVLYTPSLKANILSLGRLDEEGYDIRLHKGFLTIHDDRGFLLTKVQRSLTPIFRWLLEHVINPRRYIRPNTVFWLLKTSKVISGSMRFWMKNWRQNSTKINTGQRRCQLLPRLANHAESFMRGSVEIVRTLSDSQALSDSENKRMMAEVHVSSDGLVDLK